jgi:HlyD family secretion protein
MNPRVAGAEGQAELQIPELEGRARMRRLVLLAIAVAGIGAATYYYTRPAPVSERYRTYPAEMRELVQLVESAGRIDVQRRVEVPAPVPGRLVAIHVAQGQTVQVGQLLATLDERAAVLAVRGAEAAAQTAAGGLAQATAALDAAQRAVERTKTLLGKGLASQEDLNNAQSELTRSKAALDGARGQQRVAGENIASAKLTQQLARIEAPAEGVVLRAPERIGAAVAPDAAPLFVIGSSLATMRVDASVSETEVALIHPGQKAEVLVSALPGRTFSGQVQRVGIEPERAEGAVLYPVTLLVDNKDGLLLPGMTARVRMEVARVKNVLSVHEAALRFVPEGAPASEPRTRVWKRTGPESIEPVAVKTGISDGVYTQILPTNGSTVHPGDRLVVGLAHPGDDSGPKVTLGEKK